MMIPGTNMALRSDEEREAPSSIINACKTTAMWHLFIAFAFLSLAATIPWFLAERFAATRALMILRGFSEPQRDFTLAAVFSGTAFLCALLMFRSWYGLHTFARQRRANMVQPALRHLRRAWRTMAFATLAAAAWFGHWLYSIYFAAPPGQ